VDYIEYCKEYENYDKFVLYLLALGYNVSDTARMAEVSRKHVYEVIERNKKLITDYAVAIDGVMAGLVDEEESDEPDTDTSAPVA